MNPLDQNSHRLNRRCTNRSRRRGAAVVECALTAPILFLAVFGALEVGQYINVSQSVCNASRMGSRLAARQATTTTQTVVTKVQDYLVANGIPKAGISVSVLDSAGKKISGTDLSKIASGDRIAVQVDVQFSFVRHVSLLKSLNGAANSSTTSMRRE